LATEGKKKKCAKEQEKRDSARWVEKKVSPIVPRGRQKKWNSLGREKKITPCSPPLLNILAGLKGG